MASHVADETVKLMLRKNLPVLGSKVLVLGLTFKENCPDVRNTKVVDIVKALRTTTSMWMYTTRGLMC
jgi:UDP-N-acetyl-D-glucosamine/UDP-N-acetyl-D-galactosamine dehydrogenase